MYQAIALKTHHREQRKPASLPSGRIHVAPDAFVRAGLRRYPYHQSDTLTTQNTARCAREADECVRPYVICFGGNGCGSDTFVMVLPRGLVLDTAHAASETQATASLSSNCDESAVTGLRPPSAALGFWLPLSGFRRPGFNCCCNREP